MRSLCGFPFNTEEESTVGVEVSLCTPVTMNNVKRWIKVTDEGIIADVDVARTMARDIKMQGDLTGDTEGNDGGSNYLPQQVSSENIQVPKEVQQSPERKIETENHEATTKKILESSSKKSLKVPEGVKMSLIKYLQEKKIDETIKDKEVAISIWDFAGQHLYYASHPVFMSHRAIYILVYNLGKDLDDKAEHRARQGTREIVLDNASNETNLDNLLSWLVSVHCLCQPHTDSGVETEDYICPPVIIVGTHADELPGSEDEKKRLIQTKQRKIESAIEKCEFQNHVLRPFFVVDNSKSDDDGIKSLHLKINEVLDMEPYFPESVPIRWFHFEKALQSLVQEKKTSFLSLKELSEIAEQVCSIDQTEIAAMLNFYHDLGKIIKYGGTVVLDAKWLINLFKSLITIEPDEVKAKHRKLWRELAETGRLHTNLINHVFQEQLKYAPSETKNDAKKDILHMMEYFGLIAQIIPSDQKDGYCHLVPSHLTSSPEEELKKCQPSSDEPCPLYIRFEDGFIPHGLYFQLICQWCSLYGSQKRPNLFPIEPKLFRNAAKFVLDNNSKVIMTVVCCKSNIKVCLHSNREDKTGVDFKAVEIRNLIEESLDSLTEKCPWYQGLQYDLCIRCPLCAVNATDKAEGHPFRDDNCLHPATDGKEFCCKEKLEWPEVSGLHHWFSRQTIEPSDLQSVRGDMRVSNGLCVVINIAKFDQRLQKELRDRIGSEYDEKAMVELFGDHFGFEVVNLGNKIGAKEVKKELRNISFDKKYEDKDCFVLCIMSHGNEGVFYTSEGQTIEYKEIVSYFENDMCKSFRGKPKLFIIQACRGSGVDRGIAVTDSPADSKENQESQKSRAIHQKSSERERVIPCKADVLQAFCCSEGYISCRDQSTGSYYIQSLVRIFRRYAASKDVLWMLTKVNKDVGCKQMKLTDEPRVKQAPWHESSLRETVYFCTK
ncbi:Caspase-8 [Exaiptasia diaphana]|nr:Caspase-8 [Exaiptasia diaphana]